MSRKTLAHTTQRARIVILTQTGGCCDYFIPATVAAVIIWFLSCIPAQALGVVVFSRVVSFRRWLRGWREYLRGWRDDLGIMWMALQMTMRLEFA